ncbi:MAG TPA: hydrogenase small subunit [Candidatus Binatia bacterium]|jgi:hydrogenase small subunit
MSLKRFEFPDEPKSIGRQLMRSGVTRRQFIEFCMKLMVVAPAGMVLTSRAHAADVARAVAKARRPSVIWLHMQDCTGCTESLLRTSAPDLGELILDLISLDYHETLMAAAGTQAEAALEQAMKENFGKYILVVEGSIPRKDNGIYCKIAGRTAIDLLTDASKGAAAIIAIGSCASWGGIPSSGPNPTDAVGVTSIVHDKPIVNLPGCPANPYILLATVLEYAVVGKLPALDDLHRPLFAYDRVIHDHCPRRAHFDSGEFVRAFGDEGHRKGWCLYMMGCKGPVTHASCSTRHFNETPDCWPIGIGAPCYGCTEKDVAFHVPLFDTVRPHDIAPPATYAPIHTDQGTTSKVAIGLGGAVVGALVGGGLVAATKVSGAKDEPPPDSERPGKE